VFKKFEQHTSGTIIKIYLMAFIPSRIAEQKTKAKMMMGRENIRHSLVDRLTE
jgi:hypothetical protein